VTLGISHLLAVADSEASFARRQFWSADPVARGHLETVGRTFLAGYRAALDTRGDDLVEVLQRSPAPLRGFAYEGAGMALALLDTLCPWRRRLSTLLAGAGRAHRYMLHVGAGWALARLHRRPKPWHENDALLGWLAVDGFGFHQGYFHTAAYVERARVPRRARGYARRVFDQGLGRSLWFVCGADVRRAVQVIGRFNPCRHDDLWSGLGLAATYAGGTSRAALTKLRGDAGAFLPSVAQGAAFAAAARVEADNLTAETRLACRIFCGCEPEQAAAITQDVRARLTSGTLDQQYDAWRRGIRDALGSRDTYPGATEPTIEEGLRT
jgi:enediyne biosynthesis protein E3